MSEAQTLPAFIHSQSVGLKRMQVVLKEEKPAENVVKLVCTVEEYRAESGDLTSTDEQVEDRILYLQTLSENLIQRELNTNE